MALDERLLDILACPVDKGALLYLPDEAALYNPRLHRMYGIASDIPLMRADQARPVADERHAALLASASSGRARATLGVSVAEVLDTAAG